ncbi:SRPBCC family protein [Vallicoccus soli]|uniref:SRPBCC family protein n=1 Tax=Vallicoccus soli TaxID=2339232 RepID=A0A3A3Z165_9ACTN|nr:SRPBCC family protein [Vallicoccus soli]RJK96322.1 SRPBCC family protein [Vallicoccus soli]
MAEFEASRTVPVPPERLFEVAADVERMAAWVPMADEVHGAGADRVHLDGRDGEQDALFRARPEQRRLEWGTEADGSYAGWLQVYASGTDDRASEVNLHLSFLGDQPQAHGGAAARDVQAELERALEALAGLATSG